MLKKYQKRSSPFCKTCTVRDICIGNCSFALQDKNKKYILCDTFFIPFYQTVKEELLQVKRPILKEEMKWFNEEWEKDDKFIKNF